MAAAAALGTCGPSWPHGAGSQRTRCRSRAARARPGTAQCRIAAEGGPGQLPLRPHLDVPTIIRDGAGPARRSLRAVRCCALAPRPLRAKRQLPAMKIKSSPDKIHTVQTASVSVASRVRNPHDDRAQAAACRCSTCARPAPRRAHAARALGRRRTRRAFRGQAELPPKGVSKRGESPEIKRHHIESIETLP